MNALKFLCLPVFLSVFSPIVHAADPQPAPLTTTVTNEEGDMLVADSFSRTLYVFDLDQNKPAPVCAGDCAELWPPYILTPDEVTGLQAPLGSIARTNGKMQLTYDGRPVYTYAFDRKEGDDMGNGIGNVWHYISVDGE